MAPRFWPWPAAVNALFVALGLAVVPPAGAELALGSDDSHPSPHITIVDFHGGDTGAADLLFDRWYLEARRGRLWGWAGRSSFPFWRQVEFLWDDDVTPAGVAGGWGRTVRAAAAPQAISR